MGAYFGGIRQPLAVSGPSRIKADPTPRPQFHHVIDIVPTIYELTKITPPRVVNGFEQDSIDGVSMVYAFGDAKAPGRGRPSFSTSWPAVVSITTAGSRAPPGRASRGWRDAERHQGMVATDGQVGTLQHR